MARILVGISGGVDSSVTAAMLKANGHDVEGILLKQVNEPEECDNYVCCAEKAIALARKVCDQIGVTLHTPDVRSAFYNNVILPSTNDWEAGLVPSPCTTCNAKVRGPLLDYYRKVLECEFFATGHYFQNSSGLISRGVDPKKDQSYMVSLVDRDLFNRWMTPLGSLSKDDVRALARKMNLASSGTPDSQNLCFNHLLPEYTRELVKKTDVGLVRIGQHTGRPAVGQRKGFGGLTVIGCSKEQVIVSDTVTQKRSFNVCWKQELLRADNLTVQIAYHGASHRVIDINGNKITVDSCVVANPGQVAAFYSNSTLVGGAVISRQD